MTLDQKGGDRSNRMLWIIIAIVVGVVFIVVAIAMWRWKGSYGNGGETYPYIPTPRNTIRSISFPDLISNLILDINDTGVDYSVISRFEIQWL